MPKLEPVTALRIRPTSAALVIEFLDREVYVPWERCSARLAAATEFERQNAALSPGGYGVHWPQIGEDLSIAGLVRAAAAH